MKEARTKRKCYLTSGWPSHYINIIGPCKRADKVISVTFALLEIPDNPILCPVIDFITLALSDQAFYGVESSKALYQLQIPQGLDRMEIPFKSELLGKPICVHRGRRGRHELLQPLTADSLNYMLQKGGEHAGFKDNVTAYWLRRGAGNALDGSVPGFLNYVVFTDGRE